MALDIKNFNKLFNHLRDPLICLDDSCRILFANDAACAVYGYAKKEFRKLSLPDFIHDIPSEESLSHIKKRTCKGTQELECTCVHKNGSHLPVKFFFSFYEEQNCVVLNQTGTDSHSEELKEKLLLAVENSVDAFFLSDENQQIVHVNKSACDLLGYSFDELISMSIQQIDTDEVIYRDGALYKNGEALATDKGVFETYHTRKDGTLIPVEVTYSNIQVGDSQYNFSFARDIVERRKIESHREELRFLVDHAFDEVFMYTNEGKIHYVNESAIKETGYSREELLNMTIMDLNPDLTRELWADGWKNIRTGEDLVLEAEHVRKDGSVYPVEISVFHTPIEDVEFASAFVRNITERKQAWREAQELRFLVEHSNDQVFVYDFDGCFHYVNDSACQALGYTREELLAKRLFDIVLDHDLETMRFNWESRRTGENTRLDSNHVRKDGSLMPVEISVNYAKFDGIEYSCAFVRDATERKRALEQLESLRFAIDNSIDAIYFYDKDANITYANQSACNSLGYTREEMLKLRVHDLDTYVTDETWGPLYENVKAGSTGFDLIQSTNKRKDGTIFPVEVAPTNMTFGELEFGCSVNRDITDRVEAEKALRESEEKFRLIADTSPVALIIHRISDGTILYANSMAEMLFNKTAAEFSGNPVTSLFDSEESCKQFIELLAGSDEVLGGEFMLDNSDQETFWVSLNAKSNYLHGEKVICCAMLDTTESHNLSMQLSFQAAYDSLTGLVNRREFEVRLGRVIKTAEENQTENALCYMDLDQFKIINDTCGHVAGDELLRQLGDTLKTYVRKRDTLARLGGDEFAVLLENCNLQQAHRVANSIREAIQEFRFVWKDKSFNIGVSIGLVPIDASDQNITEVMRRADTACYQAKENGRNRIHVYHSNDDELSRRQEDMHWVTRLSSAMDQNRFQIWSQKIINIQKPFIKKEHLELLIRMIDEEGNIIPPGAFLPGAERFNLITKLDMWVCTETFRWYRDNPNSFKNLEMCSINLSGRSLSEPDVPEKIISGIEENGLSPEKFCFEITETAAIANFNAAINFVNKLKELGCCFALDDFGSGLSSFAYLKNLPVDYIKIDGIFIKDIDADLMHLSMVKSINEIVHVMGKKTIAEFVENKSVLEKLKGLGVDYAQGYGISKPQLMIEQKTDITAPFR